MNELNRVFDREDVAEFGFVQKVDHGRQRGGLARAGRAGDQHQAAWLEREVGKNLGGVELFQRQNFAGNGSEHGAWTALVVERIDPETRQPINLEREVNLQEFFKELALPVAHDVVHHGMDLFAVQWFHVDAPHVAVHTNHRRQTGGKVQVRRLVFDAECQQLGDVHESSLYFVTLAAIMTMIETQRQTVLDRIDAACRKTGRSATDVTLLAVSKTFPTAAVVEAFRAGQRAFGENYIQEGVEKIVALRDLPIEWHCIGPIQSNKTRLVAENFDWVHTVDRLKIAQRLSEQRPSDKAPLQVCIQVNVDGGANKSGVTPEEALALAKQVALLPGLRLRGLMSIPEPAPDLVAAAAVLAKVRALFNALNEEGLALDTVSMGMSTDLEAAIHAGSTMVRVGSAIFGGRAPPV